MANYDIRPLQLRILDTLMAIHKVCEEHHLRYYIIAGTLLGAVRHKGFIPWDDDLDIGMPRPDYDQLVAHCQEWLPEQYEMICTENDDNYPFPFAKIQDAHTTLMERAHIKYIGGIYLDVFPLDGAPEGTLTRCIHFGAYSVLRRIVYYMYRDPYKHGKGPSSWLPLLCQFLFTRRGIQDKMKAYMTRYKYDESRYVVDYDDGKRGIVEKSVFGKPTPIQFEGESVMGLEHYDTYLSQKYGDYMVIPPHDKQRQHNFHLLDLNLPYRDYLKQQENK